jgi:ribonuclease III
MTLLRMIETRLGVCCNDEALLTQALTHRSAGSQNNERLEFLGDAVLGVVVAEFLYTKHSRFAEGSLTRARASVVKGASLATAARRIELGPYLVLGPGELRSGGRQRDSILADALEALFGAIYLGCGLDAARAAILHVLKPELAAVRTGTMEKDPKTRLQEYLQARQLELPQYAVAGVYGQDHDQSFLVACDIASADVKTQGRGSSRRIAEQRAAEAALGQLLGSEQ